MKTTALAALACAAGVYALAGADVVFRARNAYNEGEKHLLWARAPELKKAALNAELAENERRLMLDFKAGRLARPELDQRLALARLARDEAFNESSAKLAYVWFQTSVELFSKPENHWSALSRRKMAQAKDLWRRDLEAKKIPYEDFMLE